MRLLFDINHPVQVHMMRPVVQRLAADGVSSHLVARDKDVTLRLLERFGMPAEVLAPARTGRLGAARELLAREWALLRLARRLRPHAIVGTTVHAGRVGRLVGARAIVFNDDDRAVVPWFARLAYPLADAIVTPAVLAGERLGRGHVTYPSFQQLFYLHPARFQADPGIRARLGLAEGAAYAVVRLSALSAHHDVGVRGLDREWVKELAARLSGRVAVLVSAENGVPPGLASHALRIDPERMHHALASAAFYVGDSQTMTAEAAVLGTPAFRLNGMVGRISYLAELERRGLAQGFRPGQEIDLLAALEAALADPGLAAAHRERRERLLAETIDPVPWFAGLVVAEAGRSRTAAREGSR
jgi:uncharacterized protein